MGVPARKAGGIPPFVLASLLMVVMLLEKR